MATEYLNYEDAKFSKSRGIGVFGDQVGKLTFLGLSINIGPPFPSLSTCEIDLQHQIHTTSITTTSDQLSYPLIVWTSFMDIPQKQLLFAALYYWILTSL